MGREAGFFGGKQAAGVPLRAVAELIRVGLGGIRADDAHPSHLVRVHRLRGFEHVAVHMVNRDTRKRRGVEQSRRGGVLAAHAAPQVSRS